VLGVQPSNADLLHQWGNWSSTTTENPTPDRGRSGGVPARAPIRIKHFTTAGVRRGKRGPERLHLWRGYWTG